MSAGGVVGLFLNLIFFAAFWTILGVVVDKLGQIFNLMIFQMPTYQDAVNGFNMMQTIYAVLPVIVFIALIINYWATENSMSSGEV
jgi:type II secretory pathway component PulF